MYLSFYHTFLVEISESLFSVFLFISQASNHSRDHSSPLNNGDSEEPMSEVCPGWSQAPNLQTPDQSLLPLSARFLGMLSTYRSSWGSYYFYNTKKWHRLEETQGCSKTRELETGEHSILLELLKLGSHHTQHTL